MNQIAKIENTSLSAMSEQQLMDVLKNSLYPGAKDESIKMVLAYCQASKLDPMQKSIHIVPMQVSTGRKDEKGWDIKEFRDVIMPGIGLYRTQAARSGEYGGITEPEFGEDVTETLGETQITYPKWCKVTVKRIVNGCVVEFSAKELWKENYATKSSKTTQPNSMWYRRPYAQIAKCAEAQALRKAFPEVGAQPTYDEMEGKEYGETIESASPGKPSVALPQRKSAPPATVDTGTGEVIEGSATVVQPKPENSALASEGEKNFIKNKLTAAGCDMQTVLDSCGLTDFDALTKDGFTAMKDWIKESC